MEAVGAIIVAAVIFLIFFFILSLRGPWRGWWPFLLVLLLVVWASAYYIDPIGPEYWEVYWIPLIFVGLIIALLIASLPSSEDEAVESGVDETARSEGTASTGLSAFFWILIIILAIAVIIGHLNF